MAKNEPLKRYFYEIEIMRRGDMPSLDDIQYYMENREVYISPRTIERDLEQIRRNFGIEIVYDPLNRGYYIDEEMSPNLQSFIYFLNIANTAEIFLTGISQTAEFIKDIEFDFRGGLVGIENLEVLIKAINQQRRINFKHHSYEDSEDNDVVFAPYFLKEYVGRWYVIGMRDDNKTRTYGIDRISNLELTSHKFKRIQYKKARENFEGVIGVVYSFHDQQKVVLSFTSKQGKYVKSLPWHTSQKVLIDNEEEFRISLFVKPNFELKQQILMRGSAVKVVEPKWFKDDVRKEIAKTLGNY